MSELSRIFACTGGSIAVASAVQWLWSLRAKNVTIADVYWGFGFVIVAWVAFASAGGGGLRQWLLVGLTTAWGLRLTIYLALRSCGKPEDPRYQKIRANAGPSFWLSSLRLVFGFQGAVLWVVSLPVQVGMTESDDVGPVQWTGVAVWTIGFLFEAIGDRQLSRFKSDPDNAGKIMNRGLWRYTRHPNYFGNFMIWWGLLLVGIDSVQRLWIAAGPIVMTIMLLRVSGVALLEKTMSRREGYADYVAATSAFFPWPPRRVEGGNKSSRLE